MAVSGPEAEARRAPDGRAADSRVLPLGLVTALSAAAWAILAAWSASPYARYLEHGGWDRAGALAEFCRSFPQGEIVVPALVYALAWLVMITAMMLPTTLPLLGIFGRVTAARAD